MRSGEHTVDDPGRRANFNFLSKKTQLLWERFREGARSFFESADLMAIPSGDFWQGRRAQRLPVNGPSLPFPASSTRSNSRSRLMRVPRAWQWW